MNVLAVDHVGLTVVDLERAVEFFADVLGFRERRRSHTGPEAAAAVTGVADAQIDHVFLAADGLDLELELLTYRPPAAAPVAPGPDVPGSMHLALRVDDLAAVLERARPHGWEPAGRSHTMASGPRAGAVMVYLRDPGGATLELVQAPPESSS